MQRRFFLTSLLTTYCSWAWARPRYVIAYNEMTAPLIPLVQTIYAEMGMQPVFELVPSERAMVLTNSAYYDADICRANMIRTHYPNLLLSNEPLKTLALYAYARKQSGIQITSTEQLKQIVVGVVRGSKLAEDFIEQHQLRSIAANSADSFYKMWVAKRFDVALISSTQLSAQTAQINEIAERVGGVLVQNFSYHVMHKKHAALMQEFDAILRKMRLSHRLPDLPKNFPA